jgi:hypothetical protein
MMGFFDGNAQISERFNFLSKTLRRVKTPFSGLTFMQL